MLLRSEPTEALVVPGDHAQTTVDHFLLLGVDDSGPDHEHRADTVLVAHVPRDRGRNYLISLPRDLGVDLPGQGAGKLRRDTLAEWAAAHSGSVTAGG